MNAGSWVARRRPISVDPSGARHATGPRFERFAAAMRASPPPSAQVLSETDPEVTAKATPKAAPATPASVRLRDVPLTDGPATGGHSWESKPAPPTGEYSWQPKSAPPTGGYSWEPKPASPKPTVPIEEHSQTAASAPVPPEAEQRAPEAEQTAPIPPMFDTPLAEATVIPRRPVIEDAGRSRADVPWLGIGSWLLLCGALFTSLVGWPDQIALDRVSAIWPDSLTITTLTRGPAKEEPKPAPATPDPAQGRDWSAMTPRPAMQQEALPPTELAPPIRSEPPADMSEPAGQRPPLPRFKPDVDRVAAQFSNAFFEFGDQLQQQGNLDGAVHMRRQGTNLNPWRVPGASDL
jgi:hypothetical protein